MGTINFKPDTAPTVQFTPDPVSEPNEDEEIPEVMEGRALQTGTIGGAEAALHAATANTTGLIGPAVGGLRYWAGRATGESTEEARARGDAMRAAIDPYTVYQPATESGKGMTEAIGQGVMAPFEKAAHAIEAPMSEAARTSFEEAAGDVNRTAAITPLLAATPAGAATVRGAAYDSAARGAAIDAARDASRATSPPPPPAGPLAADYAPKPSPPATAPTAPVPVPGKPHIRPKAPREPAPTAAAAAERIRAEEGGDFIESTPAAAPTAAAPAAASSAAPDRFGNAAPADTHAPGFFPAPDNLGLKSGAVGAPEQAARQAAVERGAPTLPQVRDSAITNDYNAQGRDWTGRQAGDPAAVAQTATESAALHNEAGRISSETGGQQGTGESADRVRGQAYQDWHDSTVEALDRHISATYAAEDTAAKQIASPGSNLKGVLSNDSLIDSADASHVRNSTIALGRSMGIDLTDPHAQMNAYQIEQLRKHANSVYGNAPRFAQAVKNAADADLPAGAYVNARKLRQVKADMFDNRDGINRLGQSTDKDPATGRPRPENRPVKAPDVMKTIEGMDPGQVQHIHNTMKRSASVLEALGDHDTAVKVGDKAYKAAQQMQSHFTSRWIDEASKGGGWNQRRAHQFLQGNQESLNAVLSPEQMHQIRNVSDAANVLDLDKGYKGAFAQFRSGASWLRQRLGRTAEGVITDLIPMGNTIGEMTGLSEKTRNVLGGANKAEAPKNFTRAIGPGAAQRGGPKFENNASGESSASAEAQSRVRQENAAGQNRYRIDPDGNVTPLRGVDAVDARAPSGHIIVQRGVGFQPYTVLDRGGLPASHANGLLARAQGNLAAAERERAPLGQTLFGGKQRGGPKFSPKAEAPLAGAPEGDRPNGAARAAAAAYRKSSGIGGEPLTDYRYIQPEVAKSVADAYGAMKHDPTNPKVKASYDAFKAETLAQYKQMQKAGVKVDLDPNYPYKVPRDVQEDVRANNHMSVFPTEQGFGSTSLKVGDEATIPASEILTAKRSFEGAARDNAAGAGPKTKGPLEVHKTEDGRLLLTDGQHRFAAAVARGDTHVPVKVVGEGYSDYWATPRKGDEYTGLQHPMLERAPIKMGGKDATYNDIFRAVHDYYGHVAEGNGFRANGEYNAWRAHRTMYSDAAKPAMDAETLGQNSWVYSGPHAGANAAASQTATVYADQKAGLLPPSVVKAAQQGVSAEQRHVTNLLTPQEQYQVRGAAVNRVIDAFRNAPSEKEFAAAALAGQAKRGWYRHSAEAITNAFGPDAPRFAATLAAMSPQTSVEMNFHNALRTFVNWDKAGRPSDPAAIRQIMRDSVQKQAGGVGTLPAWENNTVRALTAEDPTKVQLSGPKVHSFYNNLIGNVHEVTNDAWQAAFSKVDPAKLGGSLNKSGPGKSATYLALNARVRQAAQTLTHLTGEKWTPAEVQETVWSWAKTAFEHAEELGDRTIPELVKHGNITDELIRSTPDFHQLFSSGEHRGFLAGSRFAGAAERMATGKGEGANTAGPSKASAAAAKTLRPHLLSAAERLESVRQERNARPTEEVPF